MVVGEEVRVVKHTLLINDRIYDADYLMEVMNSHSIGNWWHFQPQHMNVAKLLQELGVLQHSDAHGYGTMYLGHKGPNFAEFHRMLHESFEDATMYEFVRKY